MRIPGWCLAALAIATPALGQELITPYPPQPIIDPNVVPIAPAVPPPGYGVFSPGLRPAYQAMPVPVMPVAYRPVAPVAVAVPMPPAATPFTPVQAKEPLNAAQVEEMVQANVVELNDPGCCGCGYWEIGYELTMVRPYFDEDSGGDADVSGFGSIPPFDFVSLDFSTRYDLGPANRLWLSYVGPGGIGGRVRYWLYHQDSNPVTAFVTDDDSTLGSTTESIVASLQVQTLDAEVLFQRRGRQWLFLGSAGLRYGRLVRNGTFEFIEINNDANDVEQDTDFFRHTFEGYGPTVSIEGRRRIAGRLSAFINARGSWLAGDSRFFQTSVAGPMTTNDQPGSLNIEATLTEDSLAAGELQLGVEYAGAGRRGEWFVRTAIEAQFWDQGGFVIGDGNNADDLSVVGVTVAAGWRHGAAGSWDVCCPDACCCGNAGWTAGYESTFLRPHFDDFTSDTAFGNIDVGDDNFSFNVAPKYDLEHAPRFYLGYAGPNGAGARIRFFMFDNDTTAQTADDIDDGTLDSTESATSALKMRVLDAELTIQGDCGQWQLLGSGGVRYAHLRQNIDLLEIQADSSTFGESREADFEGYGPTLALEGNRPVAGGLSVFAGARGSLVAGDNNSRELSVSTTNAGVVTNVEAEFGAFEHTMLVGEFQFGLQWVRNLGGGEVYIRAGYEFQRWLDGGQVLDEGTGDDRDDLTLSGFLLGAGLRR